MNVSGDRGLHFDATIDGSQFQAQINRMERDLNRITSKTISHGNVIENWAKKAASAATAFFSLNAAQGFISTLIDVRSQFQQLDIAFTTMLKSKATANALMKELVTFAAETPFGLKDAASGAKQLLAYGSTAKAVVSELRMLGDVAAGVSAPIGDLVYLYGTLKTQGRAYLMDIRQFAGRGIPIYAELAKVLKVGKDEVNGLVTAGKVGFPEIEQAFKNMTAAGSMFGGLMEAQSKTWTGQIERFKDAWDVMLNDIGKSQEDVFTLGISGITALVENYQKVLDIMGSLVVGYGAYRAALIVTAATTSILTYTTAGFTAAEILNYYWTQLLTKAQKLLNATLLANPYAAVAAALAAITTYLILAEDATLKVKTAAEAHAEAVKMQGNSVSTAESKLRVYVEILKSTNLSEGERLNIYNKIKDIDPSIVKGIDAKTISYVNLKKGVDDYIKSLREKLNLEAQEVAIKASFQRESELKQSIIDIGNEKDIYSRFGLSSPGRARERENRIKEERDKLLKQQIETNKLIGNSVQNGSKEQIKAAENDLAIIESQKKLYRKGSVELITLEKQYLEKQEEINSLRNIKRPEDPKDQAMTIVRNKSFYEKIVKDSTEALEALDKGNKDFEKSAIPLRKKIADAQRELLSFNVVDVTKQDSAEFNAQKRKAEMLNKIYELNEKYNNKSLTDDEQKLAEIRSAFKDLQREIEVYNSNPKNKKVSTNLKPALEKAIENQQYANDTKKLQVELDKQKDLYQQYEENKVALGITAAEKIRQKNGNYFNEELAENKVNYSTYLEYLEAQRAKLLDKDPMNMSGPELERLSDYNKRIDEQVKLQKEAYAVLLNDNSTYQQLKASATERYNKKISELAGNENAGRRAVLTKGYQDEVNHLSEAMLQKTDIYKKAAQEALILTRQETIKQIAALNNLIESGLIPTDQVTKIQAEISKLKFNLNIGVNEGNLNSLKDEFTRVAAQLKVKDENGTEIILSDDDYKAIITRLAEIQTKIDNIVNPGTGRVKSDFAKGLEESFDYLLKGKGASDVAKGLSKDLSQLSSGFNELSGALGGNDTQAGYLLDTIGQLTKAGSDAAGAFASFASGDIIGGITKTMSAVTSIISIGRKVKEMNAAARKEVETFYANAIAGEREYQDLLKQRELQTIRNNKIALQGIRDELKLRKSQNDEYAKEANEIMAKLNTKSFIASESYTHGTWFRKAKVNKTYGSLNGMGFEQLSQLLAQGKLEGDAKALVERLKELESKGYDAQQAIAELARETSELFTGTTSSNLTNTLSQMFAEGKTSAADLADFFKQSMDDAALSIFKNKVLAGAMESFYAEFDKAAQSGDELTSDEIATLNGLFTSLTGDALKKFEEFKKITGSDLMGKSTDQPASGVSGKIVGEALTEGTANRMLGISIGQYDEIKRQGIEARAYFEMAVSNFQVQVRIEQNTLRTADNTDQLTRLKKIEENLDQIASNTKIDSGTSLDQLLRNGGIKA